MFIISWAWNQLGTHIIAAAQIHIILLLVLRSGGSEFGNGGGGGRQSDLTILWKKTSPIQSLKIAEGYQPMTRNFLFPPPPPPLFAVGGGGGYLSWIRLCASNIKRTRCLQGVMVTQVST